MGELGTEAARLEAQLTEVKRELATVRAINAQLSDEVQWLRREADALYKLGSEISAMLDIDRILGSVVGNVRILMGVDAAALALIDQRTEEVFMKATDGIHNEEFKTLRLAKGKGLAGRVISTRRPTKVEDYSRQPTGIPLLDSIIISEGLMAHAVTPLRIGERIIGALYAFQRNVYRFSERDVNLLVALASQAAIAIENARLYGEVQQLATLSERGRIAREMHDGLAQVLGYLMLNSRSIAQHVAAGNVAEASAELEEMRGIISEAYDEVRTSILGLRTSASLAKGLTPGLTDLLADLRQRVGLQAELIRNDGDALTFDAAVEAQLIRIIQGALANVRKYAQASRVWVTFEVEGEQARVEIRDDGCGFDVSDVISGDRGEACGHYGLAIMRERAESVGGSLEVQSWPGRGTSVIVRLPYVSTSVRITD